MRASHLNHGFADSLDCRLQPSRQLLVLVRCSHGLAALLTLILAWYRPMLIWLLLPVALSYCYHRVQISLRSPSGICRLRWDAGDRWTWWRNDGLQAQGCLLGASVVGRHLVLLRLRDERHRWHTLKLCLPADGLDVASHRRLRARLTWSQPVADAGVRQRLGRGLARLRARLRPGLPD